MKTHRIHWNLHRGGLVLRNYPNITGDMEYPVAACLTDCTFVVSQSAREKIAAGAARSVHAWVDGQLCNCGAARGDVQVRYNPKRDKGFMTSDGMIARGAKHVYIRAIGVGKDSGYEVIAEEVY